MASYVNVKLLYQGDHIPHEQTYNTRHELQAIPYYGIRKKYDVRRTTMERSSAATGKIRTAFIPAIHWKFFKASCCP